MSNQHTAGNFLVRESASLIHFDGNIFEKTNHAIIQVGNDQHFIFKSSQDF